MTPSEYFKGINQEQLAPQAANYLREEILTSPALASLSPDDKDFLRLKETLLKERPEALPKDLARKELKKADYEKAISGLKAGLKYAPEQQKQKLSASIKGLEAGMKYAKKYAKGGQFEKFWSKTKEYASKGLKKTKEGTKKAYKSAKQYAKEKVHDKKKEIAIEVLDETRDKIAGNEKIPEKSALEAMKHVGRAIDVVEVEYAGGGSMKGN